MFDNQFILLLVTQIFTSGIFIGGLLASIKYIESQIKRLEEKQDKHNGLIERMVKVECSTVSAHKRMDEITKGKK